MDIQIIKMRVKHRSRVALPFLGFEAVVYLILRIAGLRQAFDLTWLVGCVSCLPYFTFRYYRESMKVKR